MSKPRIKIPLDGIDITMEALGVVAVLMLLIYPGYHFNQLPDVIPTHFNAAGEPDGFSSKGSIWTLPALGTGTYFLMMILTRFPHVFNYPTKITEVNAERQYRLVTKMMRSLNLIIVLVFCYITFQTMQTSLNLADGLSSSFLFFFLGAISLIIVTYLISVFRKKTL